MRASLLQYIAMVEKEVLLFTDTVNCCLIAELIGTVLQ